MNELTVKEQRVLDYVQQSIELEGYAPSVRDICASLGIRSTSTAHMYLRKLSEKGYIRKNDGKSRAVTLEHSRFSGGEKIIRVPLLGKVTAGVPITAVQNYDGYVDYPAGMCDVNSNLFALRVMGESMKDAGILDGDIVVVESRQYADDGEIVGAMIDDEATVKRFYKENGHYRLQPENDAYEPIIVPEVAIIGKVVSLLRSYR